MEILVKRIAKKADYTIGKMFVNGVYFCDTLEDRERELRTIADKVPGKTAIPRGTYKVVETYSKHFKRNLPELLNVPFFTAIRIHSGNTADDTEGCILLGKNTEPGKVSRSREYEQRLMLIMGKAKGENITIRIA